MLRKYRNKAPSHTRIKCINVFCAKGSSSFHNVVCLIIDTDAQSTESAETWHLTEAEASRRDNKGQNKGRRWVMIMQLSADPTHEYGSCGRDSRKGVYVRCMHILYRTVCACFRVNCLHSYMYSVSLITACLVTVFKHFDAKAFMCLYLHLILPSGAEKSINRSVRGAGCIFFQGINTPLPPGLLLSQWGHCKAP